MQVKINRQKVSKYLKSPYFSWSKRNFGSYRISKLEKAVPIFSKTFFLDITTPYNLLISENVAKFLKVKGQDNLQNTSHECVTNEPQRTSAGRPPKPIS